MKISNNTLPPVLFGASKGLSSMGKANQVIEILGDPSIPVTKAKLQQVRTAAKSAAEEGGSKAFVDVVFEKITQLVQ